MWKRAARQPRRNFVVLDRGQVVLTEQHSCASVDEAREIARLLMERTGGGSGSCPEHMQCFILNESNRFIEAIAASNQDIRCNAAQSPVQMPNVLRERVPSFA
jgi:hypothetical protein